MHWLEGYQAVFLDFDGLLVSTEPLHFLAYQRICRNRGYDLPWDFATYCTFAHSGRTTLAMGIYQAVPDLYREEPNWAILYEEKKKAYLDILVEQSAALLPGVEEFLGFLQNKKLLHCVVTNSFREQVSSIKEQIPLLQEIPYWITREDSQAPKPSPDPYLVALHKYAKEGDRVIGFEDSDKGLTALCEANIEPVLVSTLVSQAEKEHALSLGARCFSSFIEVLA